MLPRNIISIFYASRFIVSCVVRSRSTVFFSFEKMSKSALPKDWIVVTSKSYPDRVYYFNVKTRNSSWEKPSIEKSVQDRKSSGERSKKRKKSEEDEDLTASRPTTPEYDSTEKTNSPRKKLVAKRSHKRAEAKSDQEKETPQMRAIREKLLKKKEKSQGSKTNTSKSSKDSVTSTPSTKVPVKSKSTTVTTGKADNTKPEVYTPQMKVLFEKMQQRVLKCTSPKSKKSDNNNEVVEIDKESKDKEEVSSKLRRPRSQCPPRKSNISDSFRITRHSVSRSIATTDSSPEKSDQSAQKNAEMPKNTVKKKLESDTISDSIPLKRTRNSAYKKNLGKERMDKLRKSLNDTINEIEGVSSIERSLQGSSESCPILPSTKDKEEPPTVYKNAQVRLVRLRDKLLKGRVSFDKYASDTQSEHVRHGESETTVNDLVKQAVDNSFHEEMDWEPMEDEEITFEVQAVRTQLYGENHVDVTTNVPTNTLANPILEEQQEKKELFIVVDTNVFLSNVEAVELARDTSFKTYDRPIIVIPWTVIRELDYIKDNKSRQRSATLAFKARKAVQYLNKLFGSKHPRIIGQTPEDVERNKEKFAIDCPDDEILQTCLQIRDLGKSVVLLSYDKNLCNKAMIYDIVTLGRNDPFEKVDYLNASNNRSSLLSSFIEDDNRQDFQSMSISKHELHLASEIFDNIKTVVKEFLTVIVSKEMHDLYGDNWEMHVSTRPPWTIVTVLQNALKHWIAATSESFLRKAEKVLKELLNAFKGVPDGGLRLKEVESILDKCNDLIQMVKVEKHPDLMLRASHKLNELKKNLHEYEAVINKRKLEDAIGVEDNVLGQERRAEKAFQYFEAAYSYARDMSGLAAEAVGMPCTIPYEIPNPRPSLDDLKQVQPELAANVNRLLHTLTAVLEEVDNSCIDHRTLLNLHQTLITFIPETMASNSNLTPLDIYCCVMKKEEVLKAGLRQLQELSTHFCRLAQYRCR